MSLKENKQFEVFSGTGGVGKTTLATTRAIELAQAGKKILLITIDPAKRLRELLNLDLDKAGEVQTVADPLQNSEKLTLDVQLMNPEKTFEKIAKLNHCEDILDNRILKILTKPYGGLNEILAIVELNLQFQSGKYDTIILDTPPGSHFLDFLEGIDKIRIFFDQSFMDIFQYLGRKVDLSSFNLGKKLFNKFVAAGVKKLLGYLHKVTGETFVEEFIDSIIAIYKTKDSFLAALNLQTKLKDKNYSHWFLVTSVEQNKLSEALEIKDKAKGLITDESYIILNKCMSQNLTSWEPAQEKMQALKYSLKTREDQLKLKLHNKFQKILEFPEIYSLSPLEHMRGLAISWTKF